MIAPPDDVPGGGTTARAATAMRTHQDHPASVPLPRLAPRAWVNRIASENGIAKNDTPGLRDMTPALVTTSAGTRPNSPETYSHPPRR